jgi:hypothetical protein
VPLLIYSYRKNLSKVDKKKIDLDFILIFVIIFKEYALRKAIYPKIAKEKQ